MVEDFESRRRQPLFEWLQKNALWLTKQAISATLVGFLAWIFKGAAIALWFWAISLFGTSAPSNSPTPPLNPAPSLTSVPPLPPCAQQSNFENAMRGGLGALRVYIRECRSWGGVYLEQATATLEQTLINKTENCIRSSCTFTACLAIYTDDFPSGDAISTLKSEVNEERKSVRCTPPSPCTLQTHFREAADKGIDGLRSFIAECRSVGGSFVMQAKAALESNLYEQSANCIRTSCATDTCLATYLQEMPNGPRAIELRAAAETAGNSLRCKPPSPTPVKRQFCLLVNGKQLCE
jgi:hypothetical protein